MAPRSQAPTITMQGIEVPAESVNPPLFFAQTRRQLVTVDTRAFAGLGLTDTIPMLQTGIISDVFVKIDGVLTVTLAAGTCASTMRWPYDLFKKVKFSANGQSNLINCSGAKLRFREFMADWHFSDRGVSANSGGASPGTVITQGSGKYNREVWGVGQNVTAIPGAPTAYPFSLVIRVPVAYDDVTLTGAIFAQTSATSLELQIDWASVADLFVLTGAASVAMAATVTTQAMIYSIPAGPKGTVVVPDLSVFHSLTESSTVNVANGPNEFRLAGQGVGKKLLRLYGQVWNGAQPQVPLAMSAANFTQIGWRFGTNDTPEYWADGLAMAYQIERLYNCDFSTPYGLMCLDFATKFAARDSVDEATATELRAIFSIPAGVALTTPRFEYVQETASVAAAA